MTWGTASWIAAVWNLPNALAALGLFVLLYIIDVADAGPFETVVWVLLVASSFCLVALPMTAGFVHRSGKVVLLVALFECAAVSALAGMYFDFFGGWVPSGFRP